MTDYQKMLDDIVPMFQEANLVLTEPEQYKIAGWMVKRFGYEQVIQELPKVDLSVINNNCGMRGVYPFLNYHLQKLGWQTKAENEKREAKKDMESIGKIIGGLDLKEISPGWLQEARGNWKRLQQKLTLTNDHEEKQRLKIEMSRIEEKVKNIKTSIKKAEENL